MIRLLYGLTKELLRAMRRPELDDVARQLISVEKDAAGKLGKKAQIQLDETKKAVDQEKRMRAIRDEEYRIMQEEEMASSLWTPKEQGVSPELARYMKGEGRARELSDKELVHELLKNYKKK